ncbi:hypothetical protein V5O48_006034 [Marasmius crinis-equi]|uniref:F-box domain-containing protein n=1 Tax=Marasmius crinis-equi TaxID=585013 RepID=A0ABR3FL11_9AGAR
MPIEHPPTLFPTNEVLSDTRMRADSLPNEIWIMIFTCMGSDLAPVYLLISKRLLRVARLALYKTIRYTRASPITGNLAFWKTPCGASLKFTPERVIIGSKSHWHDVFPFVAGTVATFPNIRELSLIDQRIYVEDMFRVTNCKDRLASIELHNVSFVRADVYKFKQWPSGNYSLGFTRSTRLKLISVTWNSTVDPEALLPKALLSSQVEALQIDLFTFLSLRTSLTDGMLVPSCRLHAFHLMTVGLFEISFSKRYWSYLRDFLQLSSKTLVSLNLDNGSGYCPGSIQWTFPNLSCYDGPQELLPLLRSSRNLTSLHLHACVSTPPFLEGIAIWPNVRMFEFTCWDTNMVSLANLLKALPNVQVFRLVPTKYVTKEQWRQLNDVLRVHLPLIRELSVIDHFGIGKALFVGALDVEEWWGSFRNLATVRLGEKFEWKRNIEDGLWAVLSEPETVRS